MVCSCSSRASAGAAAERRGGGSARQVDLAGGLDAKEKMVESNLRLVVSIAKNYRNEGLPFST